MRYLSPSEVSTRINLGKTVEQWLEPKFDEQEQVDILRWISIDKERHNKISLRLSSVYDEGDEDMLDIYGFSSVDPEELYEEIEFDRLEDVLAYVIRELGGSRDTFLNEGMCQEEYRNHLEKKAGCQNMSSSI